jgi:hypothetical protein
VKENSIERDIHLLESYAGMTHKMNDNQGRPKLDQAIEHILQDYKRVLKENEELEEINNELEAEKNEAIRRYNFETIPKQKVKDKIEELKQEIENLPTEAYPIIEDDLQIKIEALEELLKKEQ